MNPTLNLFTCNFSRFQPPMGVPVRISNGFPRFGLKYDLIFKAPTLYPAWSLVKAGLSHEDFSRLYGEALDDIGVEKIAAELGEIARKAGDNRLVLMCFEDLSKGKTCHRRSFARWWKARTGDDVRELGPTGPEGGPRPYSQGTLL